MLPRDNKVTPAANATTGDDSAGLLDTGKNSSNPTPAVEPVATINEATPTPSSTPNSHASEIELIPAKSKNADEKDEGFFKRHLKGIIGLTVAGLVVGAATGAVLGTVGIVPTFGASGAMLPVLIAGGALVGAALGFTMGLGRALFREYVLKSTKPKKTLKATRPSTELCKEKQRVTPELRHSLHLRTSFSSQRRASATSVRLSRGGSTERLQSTLKKGPVPVNPSAIAVVANLEQAAAATSGISTVSNQEGPAGQIERIGQEKIGNHPIFSASAPAPVANKDAPRVDLTPAVMVAVG